MGGFLYLEPVISKIFPIHLLNGFTHTCNIAVLQECILRNTIHLLNVDILGKKHKTEQLTVSKRTFHSVRSMWTFSRDTCHSKQSLINIFFRERI